LRLASNPVALATTLPHTALRVLLADRVRGRGPHEARRRSEHVTLFADIGAGQLFRYVVGVLEIAGAVGLLIPLVAGMAAVGLAALMTGALVTRAAVLGETPAIEVVFLVATAGIAYDRLADIRSPATRVPR
jgi:hypothetical protein